MADPLAVPLPDGRHLVVHEGGVPAGEARLAVVWHHGSPQSGALFEPLTSAAAARGIRLISFGRPSYGGASPHPGRHVGSVGRAVMVIADALELDAFAVMGASGGGPHALACAAALSDRVPAVATFASVAPFTTDIDWFAGMRAPAALHAAREGRDARARFAETDEFDRSQFVERDWAALEGPWKALGHDAATEGTKGPDGLIDDDVALVTPWGFELAAVGQPVLFVHGVPTASSRSLTASSCSASCPTPSSGSVPGT